MKKEEVVSYISFASVYEGKITFSGTLRVDGILIGCIEKDSNGDSMLVVGKSGRVNGKVNIDKLSVEGVVEGDFYVSQRSEFIIGSKFKGKLFTPVLVVQEGAIIEGSINVPDEKGKESEEEVKAVEYGFDSGETKELKQL
jgi:cytoskeletal protein CcmA (bactofilin family)